jgi:hypothetical protein
MWLAAPVLLSRNLQEMGSGNIVLSNLGFAGA